MFKNLPDLRTLSRYDYHKFTQSKLELFIKNQKNSNYCLKCKKKTFYNTDDLNHHLIDKHGINLNDLNNSNLP